MLRQLLDLAEPRDLREHDEDVDRVRVPRELLGDLRRRAVVDQILGLRPELAVVAEGVVGALVERLLRVVADGDVREAGDRCVRLAGGGERLADAGGILDHHGASERAEDESVPDPDRALDRLRLHGADPDRWAGLLDRRRTNRALPAGRLPGAFPDLPHAVDLPLEARATPREL